MVDMPVAKLVTEALWHLDAELEKQGWDQPSRMVMVSTSPVETERFRGGVIMMQDLPGWQMYRDSAPDHQMAMGLLAVAYKEMPEELRLDAVPPNLFAIVYVSEAWQSQPVPGEEELALRLAEEHRLKEMPNKVEIRMLFMKPIVGESVMFVHERDGIARVIETERHGGAVPDLMDDLMEALTS